MKIALCFLIQGDVTQPVIWKIFLENVPASNISVYCHPKFPLEIQTPFLKRAIIKETLPTAHADISLVAATLRLLDAAYQSDNEYFILLSETTVPIVPFSTIQAGLQMAAGRSLIYYRIPAQDTEHYHRQKSLEQGFLQKNQQFMWHDQWIILHRKHLEILLKKSFLTYFRTMFAPDEHYALNVLLREGVPLHEICNTRKTFVNWTETDVKKIYDDAGRLIKNTIHPKTYFSITHADIDQARADDMWFFRKIDRSCDCSKALMFNSG